MWIYVNQKSLKYKWFRQNFICCWKKLATNDIKIKITHRVVGDGSIWEGISLINVCWVSQSVFYEVLNVVSDDVFNRKCLFNGEIMFHLEFKKDTQKVVLLEVKGLI